MRSIPQGIGTSEVDISHYRRTGVAADTYYTMLIKNPATTVASFSANNLRTAAIIITEISTLDSIAIHVSTLGAGNARIGIYDDNGNLYPNNLILDAGTVDVSSTGVKTIAISRTLNKGLYWLCMVSNVTFSAARSLALSILSYPASSFNSAGSTWIVGFSYAALPATFPAGGTVVTASPHTICVRMIQI